MINMVLAQACPYDPYIVFHYKLGFNLGNKGGIHQLEWYPHKFINPYFWGKKPIIHNLIHNTTCT